MLSRKKNAAAQNYDFDKKKNKYFQTGNQSIFPLTIDILNQEQWTVQQVKENQQKYLNILTNLWNVKYIDIHHQLSTPMKIKEIEQAELFLKQLKEQLVNR